MTDINKFSLDDFKKWMRNHSDDVPEKMDRKPSAIGVSVESKIGSKKLAETISSDDDSDLYELAIEFRHNGGLVIDVDGKNFLIEVDNGSFWIPRHYVRKV